MNITKRLETLEAVAVKATQTKAGMIILRKIIAPDAKDEPMNFATCEGQMFERGSDETEDAFIERLKSELVAKHGPGRVHRVIGRSRLTQ